MLKKIFIVIMPFMIFFLVLYPNAVNKYGYVPFDIILKEIATIEPPKFNVFIDDFRAFANVYLDFLGHFTAPDFSQIDSIFDITYLISYFFQVTTSFASMFIRMFQPMFNLIADLLKLLVDLIEYPVEVLAKIIYVFAS